MFYTDYILQEDVRHNTSVSKFNVILRQRKMFDNVVLIYAFLCVVAGFFCSDHFFQGDVLSCFFLCSFNFIRPCNLLHAKAWFRLFFILCGHWRPTFVCRCICELIARPFGIRRELNAISYLSRPRLSQIYFKELLECHSCVDLLPKTQRHPSRHQRKLQDWHS